MTTKNTYKQNHQFRFAGQLDALQGDEPNYGCHFGMRSTYEQARYEYLDGYNEIVSIFQKQAREQEVMQTVVAHPPRKVTPKQIEDALRAKFPGLGDKLIVI